MALESKQEAAEETGTARVFAIVRDRLLRGDLKPGDKLPSERDFALQLGISRTVLREALRALATLGVLDIRQGSGAFVGHPDVSVIGDALTLSLAEAATAQDDVLQARIAIECQAIRLACARAGETDLRRLAERLNEVVRSVDDPEHGGEADHQFHLAIVEASKSPILLTLYGAITPLLLRSHAARRSSVFNSPEVRAHLGEAHREIFLSIAQGDADVAEQRLRRHFDIGDQLRRNSLISEFSVI